MKAKIIKNDADYQSALSHLDTLMSAAPGSSVEEELELFSVLIEKYEDEHYPIDLPNPIKAIQFRMDQQGLTRKDLIPYIGSQSKVSEIMNGRRPLSLSMMRALHDGLGIPAEVLLQGPGKNLDVPKYDIHNYPFIEMYKRGYFKSFNGSLADAKLCAEELLTELFANYRGNTSQQVYCRSAEGLVDEHSLDAWHARALDLAYEQELPPYDPTHLTEDFVRELVRLSKFEQGPCLANELLNKIGIAFVILKHLPRTYLDGACFKSPSGRPVIGLTLRHDRLDNFWFTLIHELSHVHLHLGQNDYVFFDNTEHTTSDGCVPQEYEANNLTVKWLIPEDFWNRESINLISKISLCSFADQLGISPAIIAGRLRWETKDYQIYDDLLGRKAVRKLFADLN